MFLNLPKLSKSFRVQREVVTLTPVAQRVPAHHIAVLDVSGSMYASMEEMKMTLEKVFTAGEFADPDLRVSLISYASNGDCRIHFERQPVSDVMSGGSAALKEIRGLHTRGMTGISQALFAAEKLIREGEVTAITLHTDGYANDPSAFTEARSIAKAIEQIAAHPTVFVNTVAYRGNADFQTLDSISNRLSGKTVRAATAAAVHASMHDTMTLLLSQVVLTVPLPLNGAACVAALSGDKFVSGTSDREIRGVSAGDTITVYRFYEEANPSDSDVDPMSGIVFARAALTSGQVNLAKYALLASGAVELIGKHLRALTADQIADMVSDLDDVLFGRTIPIFQLGGELPPAPTSILEIVELLVRYSDSVKVYPKSVTKGYRRRGVRRVAGVRGENGEIVPPRYDLVAKGDDTPVPFSLEFSRERATINLKLSSPADLVDTTSAEIISEVAGIPLKLRNYRAYTIVSDGDVNVQQIEIQMTDRRVFVALSRVGAISGSYDPSARYEIRFAGRPVLSAEQTTSVSASDFEEILKLTVLEKIFSGMVQGESTQFTAEQISALREHNLSAALYYNAPTATPYTDLNAAISEGSIDTRVAYNVAFGTPTVLNADKLKSGNAYLQRRYTVTQDGKELEKPTVAAFLTGAVFSVKSLSARTKLDGVDALSFPIYQGIFGSDRSAVLPLCEGAGVDTVALTTLLDRKMSPADAVCVIADVLERIRERLTALWATFTSVSFYVAATGFIPTGLNDKAMLADDLVKLYPETNPGKAEREGLYYEVVPGLLMGVFPTVEYFSTDKA